MTRMQWFVLVVMLGCLNNGCRLGMTAGKYLPAQSPSGVTMHINTETGKYSGELIEVRAAGIVVLADQKLRLLPYSEILSSEAVQTPSRYFISKRAAPKADVQAHLRMLSRFPQGLTPELMRQLLELNGQTELAGTKP